ncbi:uncharacterized protein LOC124260726 isoform X6 [Haliotis rubra]|nr:uncharacterized protein LOC124260726 isoform X6 [Haliotis rubra]
MSHAIILQKNHVFLKEELQVDHVLSALYQKCIFTWEDYERCQHSGREKCQVFLETLRKKGVEGYKALCAALEKSQPFIKERLDATSTEEGHSDLIYVNKDKLEAQHKRELAEKDTKIAALHTEIEGLQEQFKEKDKANADLNGTIEKERAEHISQIEKKNVEVEALKIELSKADAYIQQTEADCEKVKKKLQEEQEAYDALVGVPRSQSPHWVDNTEQVQHGGTVGGGSEERVCQFSTQSCCDESQLRLLPCLHSACKPCLDHQATQAEENCIHCPSCGRDFTMEQTTVDHVRRNEAAYKLNADGEMKCNYIEGDHDAKAVVYCHECDDKLCSDCHKHHDTPKRNRNHRVSEIDESTNIPMNQWLKEASCRDHPDNKLQLYDHTCKKAICRVCELGAHNKHKNEDLNQAYDVAKGKLEEHVKKQHHKLKDVASSMKIVTSHQTELGTTQRRLEQAATNVFKSVAAKFLHRQRQLMEEIQESLQSPYKLVEEKLDILHDVHTSIVSAIDYTQRTFESTRREELITLTDVLMTKCDENLKMKLPEDARQDTNILLTFQGQKALTELIDTFGGLVSSLNVDDIPDKQATIQDLQKWNMQLTVKEEDTRKVHEGRWHQLGEIIHHITAGTVPLISGSQRLRPELLASHEVASEQLASQEVASEQLASHEVAPEPLTSQDVFEAAKHFIIGAIIPSESPERGLYLKGYSGTMHIISGKSGSRVITCPKLQLDAGRANTDRCHVTTDGDLVNSRPATQNTDSGRLQRLFGTCSSTPIPLPPPPSSVTPVLHTTRYWETHTRVGEVGGVMGFVLEVGVGEESQVDSGWYVCLQRRSWCVSVESCATHRGSVCTRVNLAGEMGKCYRNTMSDTIGTQATLHYGVVLDVGRGRIGFIDVDRSVVLGKVDVKFKEDLLPVFAVDPMGRYTINMKVVSGEEILMSDIKKSLINEVLA